jgi:hypothetical protein
LGLAFAAVVALGEKSAQAEPTKDECFTTSQTGQELHRAGKLMDAKRELLICAASSCPEAVRADCTNLVNELDREIPTIVFDAKDETGADLTEVRVSLDGYEVAHRLDGLPIALDPGQHIFAFTVPGKPPVQRAFVLVLGERARHEHIVLEAQPKEDVTTITTPTPTTFWTTRRTVGFATAAVGVVGLITGTVAGVTASNDWSRAQSECSSADCPNHDAAVSDHNATLTAATVSTVGFIAGGVLAAGGLALFLTAPSESHAAKKATSLRIAPSAGPKGGGLVLGGVF